MAWRWAALVLAAALAGAQQQAWREHQERVRRFPCARPQPAAVPVGDLTTVAPHDAYLPPVTVLHRCSRSAGCCMELAHECTTKSSEWVTLVFQVVDVVTAQPALPRFEFVEAENHTECHCADSRDLQPK